MQLPRLRFRIRWMMTVVALVAVLMGGFRLWRLRESYRQQAAWHRRLEVSSGRIARYAGAMSRIGIEPPGAGAALSKRAEYRAKMRQKYEQAAARPWLPVEPDPPAPK
jgi:hypothetical protein